jgi:hypothetical protein
MGTPLTPEDMQAYCHRPTAVAAHAVVAAAVTAGTGTGTCTVSHQQGISAIGNNHNVSFPTSNTIVVGNTNGNGPLPPPPPPHQQGHHGYPY